MNATLDLVPILENSTMKELTNAIFHHPDVQRPLLWVYLGIVVITFIIGISAIEKANAKNIGKFLLFWGLPLVLIVLAFFLLIRTGVIF